MYRVQIWNKQLYHTFADDIFKCILLNENISIQIQIPLKFVCKCPINIITWCDGFLPPVQCISAPGTTLFDPVVCLHCFNFVNTPPPSKINMKPRWEVKLWGYFQGMFWKCYHHIEVNDSFLNNTTYQYWFIIFLPVILKCTINVPCLSNHAPWQQIHKVASAQSTVIYLSKF